MDIHPNCFQCDNCSGIDFKSNESQYTDINRVNLYRLCKSCSEIVEEIDKESQIDEDE